MNSDFIIKLIPSSETIKLRHQVLRPHETLEDCIYAGDDTASTFHLGAYTKVGSKLVGIASFYSEVCSNNQFCSSPVSKASNPYRLRGMATDPTVRRLGAGRALLQEGQKLLRIRSCDLLWFNARVDAFSFYESLGFLFFGELFDIQGIGLHKVMYKHLDSR